MKEKISVLIADDNQDFSHTLSTYINSQNDMEVVGMAKDGTEAIELMRKVKPDVMILDVIMPHLDGLGVLEKINGEEERPICIMLSAVGQDKITQKAITLGAEYYVVKPFDIELLIKRIREIKFYKPNQSSNNFISNNFKKSYIELSEKDALILVNEFSDDYEKNLGEELQQMLENKDGVGKVKVLVKTTDSKEVTGVLVVCEGGDDKNLVAYITDAINGLLGVPVHKIKVMKMSE